MRDHDTESRPRWVGPGRLVSLVLMALVALGTLWIAVLIQVTLLGVLVLRLPDAKRFPWFAAAVFPVACFLSGVVTMLFSRRWLRPAPGAAAALGSVALVASVCVLIGVLAPYLMDVYITKGAMRGSLSLQGLAVDCVLWLCWVAGGLAVPLLRQRRRRERT